VLVGLHGLRPGDATSVQGTIEAVSERSVRVRLHDVLPDRARRYRVDDLSRHGMPDWQTQGLTDFLVSAMEATPVRGRELAANELPVLAQMILGVGPEPTALPPDPEVPGFVTGLNAVQRHALGAVLALAPDSGEPLLIQGPPGTGKTTLIAELVHAIALAEFGGDAAGAGERPVLLLANSHRAVDELVLKIAARYPDLAPFVVRVGQPRGGMEPAVRARVLSEAIGAKGALAAVDMAAEGAERLVALIREGNLLHDQAMVFAGTLAAAQGADLRGLSFRTVIVDECGQATEPAALQALRHMTAGFRSRLVLVGDHRQLPPVVPDPDPDHPPVRFSFPDELAASGLAAEHTLKTSLFERLAARYPRRLTSLRDQYRMNAPICDLVSNTFYEGRLRPGTPEVAARRLPDWFRLHGIAPAAGMIADGPPVLFIDTSDDPHGTDRDASLGDDSRSNEHEAAIIAALVTGLVDGLIPEMRGRVLAELGIISPYRRQNNVIQQALVKRDPQLAGDIRVDTVDRFQGGEKEIVLISLTNSNAQATIGRLHAEWRRMNVAISRARRTLVLVGDRRTFTAPSDEAEEPAKVFYRRLFAEIDRLCAAGEACIVRSETLGPGA
jgi:DNA replication ATP-dependent helicase Dna2